MITVTAFCLLYQPGVLLVVRKLDSADVRPYCRSAICSMIADSNGMQQRQVSHLAYMLDLVCTMLHPVPVNPIAVHVFWGKFLAGFCDCRHDPALQLPIIWLCKLKQIFCNAGCVYTYCLVQYMSMLCMQVKMAVLLRSM